MGKRRIEAFLLRLVVDQQHDAGAQTWCGRIQHISNGHECRFESLQEVLTFIGEQLALTEPLCPADEPIVEENLPTNA